jgi:hypothetical protein
VTVFNDTFDWNKTPLDNSDARTVDGATIQWVNGYTWQADAGATTSPSDGGDGGGDAAVDADVADGRE